MACVISNTSCLVLLTPGMCYQCNIHSFMPWWPVFCGLTWTFIFNPCVVSGSDLTRSISESWVSCYLIWILPKNNTADSTQRALQVQQMIGSLLSLNFGCFIQFLSILKKKIEMFRNSIPDWTLTYTLLNISLNNS